MDDTLKDSWEPKGPISKKIKERIQKAGKRFHSNDNISEFIKDGEMDIKDGTIKEIIVSKINPQKYSLLEAVSLDNLPKDWGTLERKIQNCIRK